ncbi:cytochrome c oxidase subunit 4 [Micrococcus porci]|uniref:cytochrome c oxidase subunit 4 n=1 Tax=Micrococcus TaxID=1269 RepID=UPI001CCFAEC5|nr:cytochrome c oxidase subunit 4 [Micrococcus porci]MCG7421278.1 cytochrome c oxidase subunit 4 [Micrococcus sp. ACRRV]UBH23834.1 cytochrome c oxidase subunit 4 [Micrococcus porci]
MKIASNIFWIIGAFLVAVATLYGFWVKWTEWAGIPAIYALGAMCWMIAWYVQSTDKRHGLGPADDEDGEIVEYAGTYGTFAPSSWWPLGVAVACAMLVTGLAVGWWIFALGVIAGVYFTFGWVYEFSRGKYAH